MEWDDTCIRNVRSARHTSEYECRLDRHKTRCSWEVFDENDELRILYLPIRSFLILDTKKDSFWVNISWYDGERGQFYLQKVHSMVEIHTLDTERILGIYSAPRIPFSFRYCWIVLCCFDA